MSKQPDPDNVKIIARNKRASHDYEILDKLECGIALQGTEVKSLRQGGVVFGDAYADVHDERLTLAGLYIPEYKMGNVHNHEPVRRRTLLAHKREIRKLSKAVDEKGLTLVPLTLYWKSGRCKVVIATARGRARHDKREALKKKEFDRQKQRLTR